MAEKRYEIVNKTFDLLAYIDEKLGLAEEFDTDGNGIMRTAATCPICGGTDFHIYDKGYDYNDMQTWHSDCLEDYLDRHADIKEKTGVSPKKEYLSSIEFFMIIDNITFRTATNKVAGIIKSQQQAQKDAKSSDEVEVEYSSQNKPKSIIKNFITILNNDKEFKGKIKYDCLGDNLEFNSNDWDKSTDAHIRYYIEDKYELYHKGKLADALNVVFSQNEYNPLIDLLEATEWDGKHRIGTMFKKWLKAEDTPLNREIERMMFMGGINRLYNFGCKFDNMIVFVGAQGCGKSTFSKKLAIKDKYFNEVRTVEDNKAVEAIKDYWICELEELVALFKAKDVESAKAFLSSTSDKVRLAFEERVTVRPRHCIFIGTTNRREFLKDKTGNRRYFPVICGTKQNENLILQNEAEAENDILQAWKEASLLFKEGKASMLFDHSLMNDLEAVREQASEDDSRLGIIQEFISDKQVTCVRQIWQEALLEKGTPARKDSTDIAEMLRSLGWNSAGRESIKPYGQQKVFKIS